jgi:hypothetical protein
MMCRYADVQIVLMLGKIIQGYNEFAKDLRSFKNFVSLLSPRHSAVITIKESTLNQKPV